MQSTPPKPVERSSVRLHNRSMGYFRRRRSEPTTPAIDPDVSWRLMEQRLATATDPRHRQILEIVIAHTKHETAADLNGVLGTLSAHPDFHFWTDGDDLGPKGADAVRNYYTALFASHAHLMEFDMDRMFLDDVGLMGEGFLRQIYPSHSAYQLGLIADDPGTDYLIEFRQLIVWAIDADGMISSIDSYNSGPSRVERLTRDQLPKAYLELINESR